MKKYLVTNIFHDEKHVYRTDAEALVRFFYLGELQRRRSAADCKSVAFGLWGFKSLFSHLQGSGRVEELHPVVHRTPFCGHRLNRFKSCLPYPAP